MNANLDTDLIEQLVRLHEMDRVCDRLQRRLDQVPVKLKSHTDMIASLEAQIAQRAAERQAAQVESDMFELEVKAKEEVREKIKVGMNAPKLSNREYEVLQEQLAGVLADINSQTDKALKAMERVAEAEASQAELERELGTVQETYESEKAKLEGGLTNTREDLAKRDDARQEYALTVGSDALMVYERVRRKHNDALAVLDGTIDRAAGRMGNDIHCSACYMAITANDALQVLARKQVVQCKSCVRILWVA